MKVGIIIVTYNNQNDIGRLFDSVLTQGYNDLVIYLVDNNSTDSTLNIVEDYRSKLNLKIIKSQENNGFAKGNNIGIQKAIDDECEFIFILNPDMQLHKKCIEILIKRISIDDKIGVIGPVVLYGDRPDDVIQVYGINANFKTQNKTILYTGKKLSDEIPDEIYVDYALGGAMLIRSNVLKLIGLFEEDYFMYNDELDLAYRIKKRGYKTLCIRSAVVKHFHNFGKSNKRGNNLMYYYIMRNRYLYYKKFRFIFTLILSIVIEVLNIPFKFRWAVKRMGNVKILKFYYSGIWDGLIGKKGIADKVF